MRSGFKMKGMDFGNSPVTKKAGPETKKVGTDNLQDNLSNKEES